LKIDPHGSQFCEPVRLRRWFDAFAASGQRQLPIRSGIARGVLNEHRGRLRFCHG
jgi:hypothetical protein